MMSTPQVTHERTLHGILFRITSSNVLNILALSHPCETRGNATFAALVAVP